MSRRMRLAMASAGIAVVLVLLIVTAIRAATTYYYTLPQFRDLGRAAVGRYVQVNGTVGGHPHWNPQTQQLTFAVLPPAAAVGRGNAPTATRLVSTAPVAPLPVTYEGAEPDAFTPGVSVVVAGRLLADGTFQARQVLVKCPSTYTAAAAGQGAKWRTT